MLIFLSIRGGKVQEEEAQKTPEFTGLRWEKDGKEIYEALVGDEVALCFEVKNINNGETVKVAVWEHDDDNEHDFVDETGGAVENGKVAITWTVVYTPDEDDGSTSGKELSKQGYTLPEYHFVAEYGRVESGESPVMEVKDTLHKQLTEEESNEILPNVNYTIKFSNGQERRGTTDGEGYVHEDNIPFGEFTIIAEET
jgi:hypothetical protein